MDAAAVVLAAGMGTRMKSDLIKVLHPLCGKPMLAHVVDALRAAGIGKTVVVVGHQQDRVREAMGETVSYAYQAEQLGTGHAVLQAREILADHSGPVLVTYGDAPLYTGKTFAGLLEEHRRRGSSATVLAARVPDPTGYGRIVRTADGSLDRIVEEKDASFEEKQIGEINTGTCVFSGPDLFRTLEQISPDNAAGEYYLPDVIPILREEGKKVEVVVAEDWRETMGINDRIQLAAADQVLRDRIRREHMRRGVTMIGPETIFIDAEVAIGRDTIVYPGTIIEGKSQIGSHCTIGPNTKIVDSILGDGVEATNAFIVDAEVETKAKIGPFCQIWPRNKE